MGGWSEAGEEPLNSRSTLVIRFLFAKLRAPKNKKVKYLQQMVPYVVPLSCRYSKMSRCSDLLEIATRNPEGLRFVDLCKLAECHGWVFARAKGSHRLYKGLAHFDR